MTESIQLLQPLRDVRLASEHGPDQAAYERGRRDGEEALNGQLLKQRAELLELQSGVLDSLRQAVPKVVHDCENAVVTLAIEAAQRLVAGLPISGEMIEASIREALAQVEEATEFFIYLHPEDLALLQKLNSPLLVPKGGRVQMRFESSAEVTRGGCLVQTRFGVIDARRETKVEQLKKALLS
jgi:flagellar assembly protein FliH